MDAVNAVIHLAAAVGFLALAIWSIQNQRRVKRIVQMSRWIGGSTPVPRQMFGNLAEHLSDICLMRNVACELSAGGGFPVGIFHLDPWLTAISPKQLKAVGLKSDRGQWKIVLSLNPASSLDESLRKSLATSVAQLKIVDVQIESGVNG